MQKLTSILSEIDAIKMQLDELRPFDPAQLKNIEDALN